MVGGLPPAMGLRPGLHWWSWWTLPYEDAEKNGGSMTFEKPLGASGWDGGSNRLVLISPGKSCSNLGDDGDISSFYSLNMWGTLPPYIGFGGRWRGTPWYPKKCSWLDDDEQDTGWYCSAYIYIYIHVYTSPFQELPVCTFYGYLLYRVNPILWIIIFPHFSAPGHVWMDKVDGTGITWHHLSPSTHGHGTPQIYSLEILKHWSMMMIYIYIITYIIWQITYYIYMFKGLLHCFCFYTYVYI